METLSKATRSGIGGPVGARIGLYAALTALAGLLLLTFVVTQDGAAGLDRPLFAAVAALRGPVSDAFLDAFFQSVTWLGSSYVLAPSVLLAMALLAARRQRAAACWFGLAYFGASLTTWLLKKAIGRERPMPHATLEVVAPADWSFPSGHATHAAAFALGLWLLAARYGPRWRMPAGIVLGVLVLLVSASRLYLQVHWPSDVLAGWLVAGLWAGLARAAAGGAAAGRAT